MNLMIVSISTTLRFDLVGFLFGGGGRGLWLKITGSGMAYIRESNGTVLQQVVHLVYLLHLDSQYCLLVV
jgi:hypothetical protein